MEKNKSILIAVISGIVACIVCVGMIFLYPKKENNLKGNVDNIEEAALGDTCESGEYFCTGDYTLVGSGSTSKCRSTVANGMPQQTCTTESFYWDGTKCWPQTRAYYRCNTYSSCDAGKYLSSAGKCVTCTAGHYCKDNNHYYCPAGTYNPEEGKGSASDCLPCSGEREWSADGATQCADCGEGNTATADHTGCVNPTLSGCSAGSWRGQNGCEQCPAGSYCPDGIHKYTCEGNTITNDTGHDHCNRTCTPGYVPNSAHSECVSCTGNTASTDGSACVDCGNRVANSNHTACIAQSTEVQTTITCAAGTYYLAGSTSCTGCPAGSYCTGGETYNTSTSLTGGIEKCPDGYTSDAGQDAQTDCYINVTPGNQLLKNASSQTACPDGYYSNATTKVYYGNKYECTACTKGTSNADHTACEGEACGVGQGKDISATTGCSNCAPGYYSGSNDDTCHKCPNGQYSGPASGSCITVSAPCCENPYGSSHTITDLYGCQQAVAGGATVNPGACPETTNPKVTKVTSSYSGSLYLTPDEYQGYGYKTVTYVAYDQNSNVIPGDKLTWSVSNQNVVVSANKNANGYVVTYHGIPCTQKSESVSVTASGTNGATGSKTSSIITIVADEYRYKDWTLYKQNADKGSYPLISEAYATSSCIAAGDYNASTGKYNLYTRCCGSGGGRTTYDYCCVKSDGSDYSWKTGQSNRTCPDGYQIDESKNSNTCKKNPIPACYKDGDNNYYWTDDPQSSWIKITEISKEQDCKETEDPACYKDTKGDYVWGLYAKSSGYTYIASITEQNKCKKPEEGEACYKNEAGDYIWGSSAPAGYTEVAGVTKPEECGPKESPACYLYGKEYKWGKYENVKGYIKIENIYNKDQCVNPEVPVPKTDFDVTKTVYMFMAVLMAAGIAFIYYSAINKKETE